jgi:alpha-L-fucosidase 2
VGNGRLGAMVFGNREKETLQLNEEAVWARSLEDRANPEVRQYLPQLRELLLQGRMEEAHYLAETTMMGAPNRLQPYQTLGEIEVLFPGHANGQSYERWLDLDSAITGVRYEVDGVS